MQRVMAAKLTRMTQKTVILQHIMDCKGCKRKQPSTDLGTVLIFRGVTSKNHFKTLGQRISETTFKPRTKYKPLSCNNHAKGTTGHGS